MLRLSCLFLTLLVGFATSGPVSFKGRESSYDYKVSVGRQDCDGVFQTGFTIATKVTVRQRTNDAYNIQLTELKVQDGSEVDLADGTYSALKEKLLTPFDFDTKSGQLTVYSPETIECESVNIKRGLVNVLEVYNEQSKTFTRISTKSSSGQCREIETKLSEKSGITELNRFISLAGNCSSSLPHIGVNTKGIAKGNLYCNRQPQVTRHATAKILRSGASASSPSFKYTGSEQLHLQSTFTHGLFDDVFAKTHLELSEVRDLTSQSWTPGTSGSTTSEVTLNSKWELDQEVARGKAAESFKELDHCLHKLDSSDHLEDQDIATTIATLLYNLRPLNKASLVELYNSLEGTNKNAAFFQLLGLTGTPASFEAFEELFVKITTESPAALTTLGDTFSVYFERLDVDKLPAKTVTSMYEFWKTQLSKNTKAPQRLRNTVLLTCSAALFEACFREGSSAENCPKRCQNC
ncbi:hypothetical protein HDE_00338 [Halotydeus destructor]|nr:hypothetical protein HDE_00338 [Halotydeus destructor]